MSPYQILAIDDESRMRYVWSDMGLEGLDVRQVFSVDEAIPLLAATEFDLIIIDRQMPGGATFPDVADIEVGYLLYKKIRREVDPVRPIAILTNFYEGTTGRDMENADPRLRVLDKKMASRDIIFALKALIEAAAPPPDEEAVEEA
jgi:CheY-like chemotaxis protein